MDNSIILQEPIHSMNNSNPNFGHMLLNLDLQKAYNRLEWDFIVDTLFLAGFLAWMVNVIRYCLSTSEFAINWNGSKTNPISPTRRLRQRDPLSPYLFILCLEHMAHMIQDSTSQGS